MSWIFEFQAPERQRVHRYFWCCTIMDHREPDLWWVDELNGFFPHGSPELKIHGHSNSSKPIRTFKAFCRFLRRHPELRGRDVTLVNRYVGYDIIARAA